jgi:TolB-like protein
MIRLYIGVCACLISLLGMSISSIAYAQKKVAVLDLQNKSQGKVSNDEVSFLSDEIRGMISRLPKSQYIVMTKESMEVMLPVDKTLEDCVGTCEVDTGRLLGVHWIVTGDVLKFGSSLRVALKLHETKGGQFLGSSNAKGKQIDELEKPIRLATLKLIYLLKPTLTSYYKGLVGPDMNRQLECYLNEQACETPQTVTTRPVVRSNAKLVNGKFNLRVRVLEGFNPLAGLLVLYGGREYKSDSKGYVMIEDILHSVKEINLVVSDPNQFYKKNAVALLAPRSEVNELDYQVLMKAKYSYLSVESQFGTAVLVNGVRHNVPVKKLKVLSPVEVKVLPKDGYFEFEKKVILAVKESKALTVKLTPIPVTLIDCGYRKAKVSVNDKVLGKSPQSYKGVGQLKIACQLEGYDDLVKEVKVAREGHEAVKMNFVRYAKKERASNKSSGIVWSSVGGGLFVAGLVMNLYGGSLANERDALVKNGKFVRVGSDTEYSSLNDDAVVFGNGGLLMMGVGAVSALVGVIKLVNLPKRLRTRPKVSSSWDVLPSVTDDQASVLLNVKF